MLHLWIFLHRKFVPGIMRQAIKHKLVSRTAAVMNSEFDLLAISNRQYVWNEEHFAIIHILHRHIDNTCWLRRITRLACGEYLLAVLVF